MPTTDPTLAAAPRLTSAQVQVALNDGQEIAFLDIREEGVYERNHILRAASAPLSRLELQAACLIPRLSVRIVLVDQHEEIADRAVAVLRHAGYTDIAVLAGGLDGWLAAGYPQFNGVYVPSKTFGEIIEHELDTPHISGGELVDLVARGTDLVILDTRTPEEYGARTIPGAINVPGAEIVYRIDAVAPSPDTLVVVACGGRTRSILGAQSLINAGVPHRVVSLANGAQGWLRDGRELELGARRRAAQPSAAQQALARVRADAAARHIGVRRIGAAELARFEAERENRSLYLFDVRPEAEYETGHRPGWRNAPGGQLVQATDSYIGTLGARVVLHDVQGVRALMTAYWLQQLGGYDVYLLEDDRAVALEAGAERLSVPALAYPAAPWLEADALHARQQAGDVAVFDIDNSLAFRKRHVPGAWFTTRVALPDHLAHAGDAAAVVITSSDGVLASLAAAELRATTGRDVYWLLGGTAAWGKAGYAFESGGERVLSGEDDIRHGPWAFDGARQRQEIDAYLSWEIDLVRRFEADGDGRIQVAAIPPRLTEAAGA